MTDKPTAEQIDDIGDVQLSEQMNAFFERADAFIGLANSQLSPQSHAGQVGSSLMYAAARFSASVASIGFVKAEDFAKEKEEILRFYTEQFQKMLSDNLDEYAQHFDKYTKLKAGDQA
ncbi:hypothetical protein B0181_10195 [Moraxella caviae]|uniref:Protein of uncharacterized function (DUF3144) n=1 Tax=Moraxella caviae TaxID=34060 RepID=A0A1S9ZVV0_9GAMM|nr:DUF3144 domain-containing protein [Moraxella caviae]OOR87537.1 hypothetical protein B0181_10195 [Moraxella caviae]STZ10070.1 Protein of uncharacterised function (DUF3144) [Moraxella caviae]VEW11132.1 Protein of uncharacterised function (DUF3144) [Moraxella caviae]